MEDLIFLEPYLKEVIWGGDKIKKEYGYKTDKDKIGEAWVVSANDNGQSIVKDGKYKGLSLKELWDKYPNLFNNKNKEEVFPILLKYIDARDDLSIQVHPNDEYAYVNENKSKGKTECWYILDCEKDADIIIGHTAKSKEHLRELIENKKWDELLVKFPIKKGDFFYIPSGTVHAIRKGTLVFEAQQNSDITYRLYDYDRLQNGKLRELHIEKSIDVTICPHEDIKTVKEKKETDKYDFQTLVETNLFTLNKIDIKKEYEFNEKKDFVVVCVIDGKGSINGKSIKKGDNFIIPYNYGAAKFEGMLSINLIYV